jgi:hypothetical protein
MSNTVSGNYIGFNANGAGENWNSATGIEILGGASYNIIGGATSGERNVISDLGRGLSIFREAHHNIIRGNYIGTDVSGTAPLGNRWQGIELSSGAHHNTIGGSTAADGNIISYNQEHGIQVRDNGTHSNVIQNNRIGIDADGTGGLDARDLVVAGDGTVFMASYGRGVFKSVDRATSWQEANNGLGTTKIEVLTVSPSYAADSTVWAWGEGQLYITTDGGANWSVRSGTLATGLRALAVSPNYAADSTLLAAVNEQGIYRSMDGGSSWQKVFDTWAADNIAFSPQFAADKLVLAGLRSSGLVRSTDGGSTWIDSSAGLADVPVYDIAFAADGETVLLASHKCGENEGIYRSQDGGQSWTASGEGLIDCGSEWQIALSPEFLTDGIALAAEDLPYRSTDGGQTWQRASHWFWTSSRGIALAFSPDVEGVAYLNNFAGVHKTTDAGAYWSWAGGNLADRGNGGPGSDVCCGAGPTQITGNVIGGNGGQGIAINSPEAMGTLIEGNLVGLGPDGVTRAGNGGTNIWIETPYITIMNNTSAAGGHGGLRSSQSAHHLMIQGNRFGTDKTGTVAIGNSYDGLTLESSWDVVRGNVASGNLGAGMWASENMTATHHSLFVGNRIGLNADGTAALPNQSVGLGINGSYHTIGGSSSADRNIISGNIAGVALFDGAHHITITGNYIGADITGLNAIPNRWSGVEISRDASDNRIGGASAGEANVIAYNGGDGVAIAGSNTLRNIIVHNSIHSNERLGINLMNGGNTELSAPVIAIFDIMEGTASGTTCSGCVVEIFSDSGGQGRMFEASATADAGGQWAVAKGAPFAGPELTATATDAAGNTSEFGKDWPAAPPPAPWIAAPVCGVTNQPQPRFAGMAQMGSTVTLAAGATQLGGTTTGADNQWFLTPPVSLTDGAHQVKAQANTIHGSSPVAALALTVNSGLCYDPVRITFAQQGTLQRPRNQAGCVVPGDASSVTLWPSRPVTVSVPLASSAGSAFVEVNSVRYDLEDADADGVYSAEFTPPASGNLVILLAVNCGAQQQTMQIGSTIDPDGYVYDAEKSAETGSLVRIAGAVVTLLMHDTARNKWVPWEAGLYGQNNPQVTGPDGYFAFFTPPGQFKLVADATAQGYLGYTSPILTVVDEPLRYNVGLTTTSRMMLYLPAVRK